MNNFNIMGEFLSISEDKIKSGATVYTIEIKHTKSWKSGSGEWQNKEMPICVKCYGKLGESLKYAQAGDMVCLSGEISGKEYVKDGKRFVFLELTATTGMYGMPEGDI